MSCGSKTKSMVTVVIIGYNEGPNLAACLDSVIKKREDLPFRLEIVFVDGGSSDNSLEIARGKGLDQILGGEKRRKAAENRNLGLFASKGEYVQFIDGDMIVEDGWLEIAYDYLENHTRAAAVCGNLNEQSESIFSRALEIDWGVREEKIRHCGGAALWRKSAIMKVNGFPEDVAYGEEPYLCWRIRNEFDYYIYQLNLPMVIHDLGHVNVKDYWKRTVRTGRTYSEICGRVRDTGDPLWCREVKNNYLWLLILLVLVLATIIPGIFSPLCNLVAFGLLLLAVGRKVIYGLREGKSFAVSLIYGFHTYFSKIPLAIGQLQWRLNQNKSRR